MLFLRQTSRTVAPELSASRRVGIICSFKVIGIDEISIRKRHVYRIVVSDLICLHL